MPTGGRPSSASVSACRNSTVTTRSARVGRTGEARATLSPARALRGTPAMAAHRPATTARRVGHAGPLMRVARRAGAARTGPAPRPAPSAPPVGSSAGASSVRAAMSAQTVDRAPTSIATGMRVPWRAKPMRRARCGATSPTKPIGPTTATEAPVRSATSPMASGSTCRSATPRPPEVSTPRRSTSRRRASTNNAGAMRQGRAGGRGRPPIRGIGAADEPDESTGGLRPRLDDEGLDRGGEEPGEGKARQGQREGREGAPADRKDEAERRGRASDGKGHRARAPQRRVDQPAGQHRQRRALDEAEDVRRGQRVAHHALQHASGRRQHRARHRRDEDARAADVEDARRDRVAARDGGGDPGRGEPRLADAEPDRADEEERAAEGDEDGAQGETPGGGGGRNGVRVGGVPRPSGPSRRGGARREGPS